MNTPDETKIGRKSSKWDFLLRILSVVFAILIWFWVIGFETQITRKKFASIQVQIDKQSLSDMESKYGYTIIVDKEVYIDVTLEGKSSDLNKVKASDIRVYVDLKNVSQAGEISLPIEIKEMDYVQVAEQSQSSTILYIDVKTSRNIPVEAKIVQMVTESNIEIGELKKNPDSVVVYGPKGVLDTLNHALVNISLGFEPVNRPAKVTEKFILINENGDEVKNQYITTKEVTAINIEIPVTITKEVPLLANYRHGYYNNKNTNISIIPDKIEIRGVPDDINRIESIYLKDIIDEKKYDHDTTIMNSAVLPEGVESLNGETAQIEIKFIDPDTKFIRIPTRMNSNFNVVRPQNAEYRIKEDNVQIKILGPSENLRSINSSRISVTVDLSAYEKGTHSDIPLDILVISDDAVFCVGEYFVSAEIY
ncbi:MAG: CdaR family protein [Oscillospiraceae bacterium]|nr:CdaR family protein [Oscillospiraceae bacterium]